VSNPEALAGCTKIGILRVSADWLWWSDSVEYERRVRARVTNLGGNTIVEGDIGAIHPYVEVWSCPEEQVVAPK
jgi:hypothetical protein